MKNSWLFTACICLSALLSACGGGDNGSDSGSNNSKTLSLPGVGNNAYAQAFNLGYASSSAFSAVDGFQVTVGGLTQTLHISSGNGSWYVSWDGEYEGDVFSDWTAFGYEETPASNDLIGRFYFYHYNSDVINSELSYYRNGRIFLNVQDDSGTTESTALLVPKSNGGIRIISKDASEASATIVDLNDANGSSGTGYEGCTDDLFTLASDSSSCTSAVAF
ncbi:hypothetical protein [Thalassolituus alkanivorans]|uniref:hypothetical protein n=1 Tax=Thalassolituus alkanivorans TaxID=2881055 RepID=UPI000C4BF57E|nr:hypothetical protein [Thalassolituus alkanivorans]MAY15718.1 hypothetical protein [Oceanospirillaceae bacterium]MCB2386412.1 hypothetical protein [Thalassolituus alkanivorans]MCB2422159.1 hypothetical protein [Thalassolituus alkanivorans]